VRIATFNVLHGRSPSDGIVDLERFATAVADLDADVLGLQEVDRDQPRSHGADLTALAAEAMGAREQRFVAALVGTPGEEWTAATDGEPSASRGYGIALLSRYPVVSWQVIRLPALRAGLPMWIKDSRAPVWVRDEPRVAVAAVLDGPFGEFTVCTTHLSFLPGWSALQLRRLVRSLTGAREPLVLLGDLNMGAGPATRITGLRGLATAPTFPIDEPRRQIDHVLARGGLRATGPVETPRLPLSDHRPLLVPCGPL
jgi:endonuclease/exonuclease/phosphatase family metal-dependent hydrolase